MVKRFLRSWTAIILIACLLFPLFPLKAQAASYVVSGNNSVSIPVSGYEEGTANYNCRQFAGMVYELIWGKSFTSYRGTSDDMLRSVPTGSARAITVENTKAFISAAKLGATVRVSTNLEGGDSGSGSMHSVILIQKDRDGFTIYEGNHSGKVNIEYYTWEDYAKRNAYYKYFKYIKYPGAAEFTPGTVIEVEEEEDDSVLLGTAPVAEEIKYTVTATAKTGGSISPAGETVAKAKETLSYTIKPNRGYIIGNVIVDGMSVGAPSIYTFTDLSQDHTIVATFKKTSSFSNFADKNEFSNKKFQDVPESAWYYENVKKAYQLGLMDGMSTGQFGPGGDLTVAQAIALAARLHSIYNTGTENFTQSGTWYQVYVDYCLENGIISASQFDDYKRLATRAEFARLLAAAFPDEALTEINTVLNHSIPDISELSWQESSAVYKLYRAGILTGKDAQGSFYPTTNITRAETAVLVTRMADPSLRKSITLN